MKKNVKKVKAFTLVELIVVMVILALLMALVVPNVTRYIDKANDLKVRSEVKACLTALQTYAAEQYGNGVTTSDAMLTAIQKGVEKKDGSEIYAIANIPDDCYISGLNINTSAADTYNNTFLGANIDGSKIKSFSYIKKSADGKTTTMIGKYRNGKIYVGKELEKTINDANK